MMVGGLTGGLLGYGLGGGWGGGRSTRAVKGIGGLMSHIIFL